MTLLLGHRERRVLEAGPSPPEEPLLPGQARAPRTDGQDSSCPVALLICGSLSSGHPQLPVDLISIPSLLAVGVAVAGRGGLLSFHRPSPRAGFLPSLGQTNGTLAQE